MKTYTVTYNVTLTIEVQADSAEEAERLADRELPAHRDVDLRRELPSHCDVNRADGRGLDRAGLPLACRGHQASTSRAPIRSRGTNARRSEAWQATLRVE